MPVNQLSLSNKISFQLQSSNPFGTPKEGPSSVIFNLGNVNVTTWNQVFAEDFVIFVQQPSGLAAALVSGGFLTVSQAYYYKITATGGTQETEGSNEVTATPTSGNQSIKLTWPVQSQATGYKIYRGTASGSENTLIATIPLGNAKSFTDTGETTTSASPPSSNTAGISVPTQNALVTSATGGALGANAYFYVVTATDVSGETTASNEQTIQCGSAASTVTISWGTVSGATGYKVYRGTAAARENVLIATLGSGTLTSFLDTGEVTSSASPPGSMPNDFIEFSLNSFTNLIGETVTANYVLSLVLAPSGPNAQCLLTPGQTNGLTWFFSGTSPGIKIPVTPISGQGGSFSFSAPADNVGQTMTSSTNTMRITNGGTGNLSCSVVGIVGS